MNGVDPDGGCFCWVGPVLNAIGSGAGGVAAAAGSGMANGMVNSGGYGNIEEPS